MRASCHLPARRIDHLAASDYGARQSRRCVMRSRLLVRPRSIVLAAAGGLMLLGGAVAAPTVGSPNTATADPPVAVPATTPCVVPLFAGVQFADFSPKPFSF